MNCSFLINKNLVIQDPSCAIASANGLMDTGSTTLYSTGLDAVWEIDKEKERRASLRVAVEAARAAEELAQDQYRNGLSDFNNVLDAQRSLLSFQEKLAVSEVTVSQNAVRLYKALGGGWRSFEE